MGIASSRSLDYEQVPKIPFRVLNYRKGKRRKDNDSAKGLRNNGEPYYLPGKGRAKRGSTWTKVFIYGSDLTVTETG